MPMRVLRLLVVLFFVSSPCLAKKESDLGDGVIQANAYGGAVEVTRAVSLSPAATEMLVRLQATGNLVGITQHSTGYRETAGATVVGGFLHPRPELVESLQPDLLLYVPLQQAMVEKLAIGGRKICFSEHGIAASFAQLQLLGQLFHREQQAAELIDEQQKLLGLIKEKTERFPSERRKRVIRVMSVEPLRVVGDDSFQNELIRAAGGVPPEFGRKGNSIEVSLQEWQHFNPQVIYGCGAATELATALSQPGWREADAIRNSAIFSYPCELTCRTATHVGDFVASLAADIYRQEFTADDNLVRPEQVVSRTGIEAEAAFPPFVAEVAQLVSTDRDFAHKTLVLTLTEPMQALSSLEGWQDNIQVVANHYLPPPSWGFADDYPTMRRRTLSILGLPESTTAMLFTGADMDNRAIVSEGFRALQVTAIVTAGVAGNSMRMGRDTGSFYEPDAHQEGETPGTINIILLTNMRLSPRAMTRAMITVTEAKTAALQDLDVRSSYNPLRFAATGTGTDNIIVVAGKGGEIDASGGHTKMGELIGRAVHAGVFEAIAKQNGWSAHRSVFQRLRERKIALDDVCHRFSLDASCPQLLEGALLDGRYGDFLLSMFAISDAYERGTIRDLESVDAWCTSVAAASSDKDKPGRGVSPGSTGYPLVIEKAFGALLAAIDAGRSDGGR